MVGVGMGLLFEFLLLHWLPGYFGIGSVIVFVVIGIISYGFELASLIFKKGHYDVMDAVAGILGGAVGMVVIIIAR